MSEMSPETALEMIQEVAANVGVKAPAAVDENDMAKLLLNYLNRSLQHSIMSYDWSALTVFVTQPLDLSLPNLYLPLAKDWLKFMTKYIFVSDGRSSGSAYRKFTHCSPEEAINSLYETAKRQYNRFFVRQGNIWLIPANVPSAAESGVLTFNYYYKSCEAVFNTDDIARSLKKSFTMDIDKSLLDPELIILGAITFYKKFSGQPYDVAAQAFNERLNSLVDGDSLSNFNPDVTNEGHVSNAALT
jgi:hypothetical protein